MVSIAVRVDRKNHVMPSFYTKVINDYSTVFFLSHAIGNATHFK